MAEPAGVPPPFVLPNPNMSRLGSVPQPVLPVLYSGPPLAVPDTAPARLGAAFRSSWLGAIVTAPSGPTFVEEGFDAVAAANAVDFPEDRQWLSHARSRAEFDTLLLAADQRRRDRSLAIENPISHLFFTAALDPVSYAAPGSTWIRGSTTAAQAFGRGAVIGGTMLGGSEALHAFADSHVGLSQVGLATLGGTVIMGLVGTAMRNTRPAASAMGRYLDGQQVDAAALARGEGPAFLNPDALAGDIAAAPRGTVTLGEAAATSPPSTIGRISPNDDWGVDELRGAVAGMSPEMRARLSPEAVAYLEEQGVSLRSGGAAATPPSAVTQTGQFNPVATGVWLENIGMSPMGRLIASPIDFVGEAVSTLTQIPYLVRRNLKGYANPGNVASDQYPLQSRLAHTLRDYDEAYMAQRGVNRLQALVEDVTGRRPPAALSASDFSLRVWQRLHAQVDDVLPEVNRAAASMRKLYDEIGDMASTPGVDFFPAASVRTPKRWQTVNGEIVESYANRVWNTNAILGDRANFEAAVRSWLAGSGGDVSQARKIVDDILLDRPFRAIDDEHVGMATSAYKRKFDAPSTVFQRWLVTDPQELLAHYVRTMGIDISLARRTGSVNAKALLDSAREEWFRDIGRRMGTNGQRAFDDLQKELKTLSDRTSAAYKALDTQFAGSPPLDEIARVRDLATATKEAHLANARSALNAGDADWARMTQELDDLRAVRDLLRGTYGQWDQSRDWIPRALASARKIAMMSGLTGVVSQISDVGALVMKEGFVRTFGTAFDALHAGMGTIKMSNAETRLAGGTLDMMDASRVMGMADLAADISGRHTMFERVLDKATRASFFLNGMNPWTAFAKGWAGMVIASRIADDVEAVAFQAIRQDVVRLHVPSQARLTELHHLIDARALGGYVPTAAETAAWSAERAQLQMQLATLPALTRAERHALRIAELEHLLANPTVISGTRTKIFAHADELRQARRELSAAAAAADKQATARLARAGIDPDMAREISVQLRRHGSSRDSVQLPNTERWSSADAREAFRRALAEDVDNAIVSADPASRSLWLSKPIGQTIGMFQAYGQAVVQKLLVPALQEKDSRLLSGAALMIGAGVISDQLRRQLTGNTQPQSASEALLRGIDRSGVTGWFGQLFQAASGMFDNRYGPAFVGAPQMPPLGLPVGMAMSPDGLIRALGPVAGQARNLVDLTFRTATMDWGPQTARDARRLLPLNNVTHTYFAFDALERLLAGSGHSEPAVQNEARRAMAQSSALTPARRSS